MNKRNPMNIFFDDVSRELLFSLVNRRDPRDIASENDDIFEPTISAVFCLFDELMNKYTPDLYQTEWQLICEKISYSTSALLWLQRLPSSIDRIRTALVMSIEDVRYTENSQINNFELSKKVAGFSDISLCAIYYHVQKYLVANKRGQSYELPKIHFKG